jgi:phosphate starvation-inducible PhoH-like protein
MVVNGDITQIDLPAGKVSGLLNATEVLGGVEGICFVQFDDRDVVRHSLVQRIVLAYERYNKQIGAGRQLSLKLASDAPPEPIPENSPLPIGEGVAQAPNA